MMYDPDAPVGQLISPCPITEAARHGKCRQCGKGLDDISISYLVLQAAGRLICKYCRDRERQQQARGDAA